MIPQAALDLIASLRTTVAAIARAAGLAQPLKHAYEIAQKVSGRGAFFKFLAESVKAGIPRKDAAGLYGAARFFAAPAGVYGEFPRQSVIDPILARTISAPGSSEARFGIERLQIQITLTDPATGIQYKRGFYVATVGPVPLQEAFADAWLQMQSVVEKYPEEQSVYDMGPSVATFTVTDYVRFTQ
jgi:hypothetical protein